MKNWAFRRPYCNPASGFVLAKTGQEAIKLLNYAYGYCIGTTVFCAETDETYKEE